MCPIFICFIAYAAVALGLDTLLTIKAEKGWLIRLPCHPHFLIADEIGWFSLLWGYIAVINILLLLYYIVALPFRLYKRLQRYLIKRGK